MSRRQSTRPAARPLGLDINPERRWAAEGNVFKEEHSHGIRKLVTTPELLAPFD